ncbi:MAG: deoxyribonuclease V [Anaerolineae bacterium]
MRLVSPHPWNVSVEEATAIQQKLAQQVVRENAVAVESVRCVAGVDVGFVGATARAAVVVCEFPSLRPIAHSLAQVPVSFPYIPGLLAFREGPAVLAALEALDVWPDVFIFDAQGIAHPRRLGLASHMGVVLDWPSIGCAKSRLIGQYAVPPAERGAWTPLTDGQECIGAVLRTRAGVEPVFISIGHRVDLETAVEMVLRCTTQYRLPEAGRLAHMLASRGTLPSGMFQGRLF